MGEKAIKLLISTLKLLRSEVSVTVLLVIIICTLNIGHFSRPLRD
jgi:hypothetical protein